MSNFAAMNIKFHNPLTHSRVMTSMIISGNPNAAYGFWKVSLAFCILLPERLLIQILKLPARLPLLHSFIR